eukprot:3152181-Lingulodinium_polyedra.AAC.1
MSFDAAARCQPGLFAEGRHRLDFEIECGSVVLEPFYQAGGEHELAGHIVGAIERQLKSRPPRLHLWQLLLVLWRGGKALEWCFRQVLVIAGLAVDTYLPQLGLATDA